MTPVGLRVAYIITHLSSIAAPAKPVISKVEGHKYEDAKKIADHVLALTAYRPSVAVRGRI